MCTLLMSAFILGCKNEPKDNTPWQPLFDGKTLEGWTILGGNATYEIENGEIVGKTVHNTPNTFLTTDKDYGDFILELDYLVDSTMNSGIQIRSASIPGYQNGRVHGLRCASCP